MFLLLDANIIVANPLLRGRQWDAVADAVASEALDLYVPELAIDEAVARYRDGAASREREAKKALKNWPPRSRELIQQAIEASDTFAAEYESLLRTRLEQMGAEIVDYPEVEHREIARRAISRAAPFDSEGNGYRDALHWHVFVDLLLSCEPEDPYAFLLSADKRAFGPSRHRELLADVEELGVEWDVQILASISEFVVPGQFLDEEGELEYEQEVQLRDAIQDAVLAGGTPKDFTQTLAAKTDFDAADVLEILMLDIHVERVQVERKSRDLWINYTAQATCLVKLESIEILDEDAGDYATHRDTAVWVLDLSVNAYSSGNRIEDVASLRLDAVDGETQSAGR